MIGYIYKRNDVELKKKNNRLCFTPITEEDKKEGHMSPGKCN